MASKRLSVREAAETFLAAHPDGLSAYDVALKAGLIGCAKAGPPDLSTNPKYFEGFGKSCGRGRQPGWA